MNRITEAPGDQVKESTVEAKLRDFLGALETDGAILAASVEGLADKICGIQERGEALVEKAAVFPCDLNTLVDSILREYKRNFERANSALKRAHNTLGEFEPPPLKMAAETGPPRRC